MIVPILLKSKKTASDGGFWSAAVARLLYDLMPGSDITIEWQ